MMRITVAVGQIYFADKDYVDILDCYSTEVLTGNPKVRYYSPVVNWADDPESYYPDFSGSTCAGSIHMKNRSSLKI